MTLEKTAVFYRRTDRLRYAARISRPISVDTWQRTQDMNFAFNRAASLQQSESGVSTLKFASLQQSESCVSSVFSSSHLFNKVRVMLRFKVRVSSTKWEPPLFCILKFASLQQSESRIFTSKFTSLQQSESHVSSVFSSSRLFNKVRATSPLQRSYLFNEWESRLHFRCGPCLQGNMTFASIRAIFSLYFCNQFNSTLANTVDYFSRFEIHHNQLRAPMGYKLSI